MSTPTRPHPPRSEGPHDPDFIPSPTHTDPTPRQVTTRAVRRIINDYSSFKELERLGIEEVVFYSG